MFINEGSDDQMTEYVRILDKYVLASGTGKFFSNMKFVEGILLLTIIVLPK